MKRRIIILLLLLTAFLTLLCVHHSLLKDMPEDRVEVLLDGERTVLTSPNLFTAQEAEAETGGTILDYCWAGAVLRQSASLWTAFGALLLLLLTAYFLYCLIKSEVVRAKSELKVKYPREYLEEGSVRLLAKSVAAALCVLLAVLLVHFLWNFELTLPRLFLPPGSLFDANHYREWFGGTFPQENISEYAASLLRLLKTAHALAAAECGTLIVIALVCRKEMRHWIGGISI